MQKIQNHICLGQNLRRLRKANGLTQEQVATQLQLLGCDITRSLYSRYETGELNIAVAHLAALTIVFKCDFNAIFEQNAPSSTL